MSSSSLAPDEIRALRGPLSRAAFAQQVGVTPHTVYRWELPVLAMESRRPRGAELQRLLELREGPRRASTRHGEGARPAAPPAGNPPSAAPGDDLAEVLAAIDTLLRDDWNSGRSALLRIVTRVRPASLDSRALAASGLALVDALLRADPRSALGTLAPALSDAEDERLGAHAAAWVYAVAACIHALPDATLFDPGRIQAHAARAELLARGASPEVAFLAWLAIVHGSVLVGEEELIERALNRHELVPWRDLPPLLAVHELEIRALRASFGGQRALALKLTEETIALAAAHRYEVVEARALAVLAVRRLDDLVDPTQILALARRSHQLARHSRSAPSSHTLFATRAELEALLRAGRIEEALAAADELESYVRETGMPPLPAVTTLSRLYYLTGRYEPLVEMARRLRECAAPALRTICRASASMVDAMRLLGTSEDPEATVEAFGRAAADARGWNFLLRDVLVFGCSAYLLTGSEPETRSALRRAQRLLDRFPSSWSSAHLTRVEGTLAAVHGRWSQGRQLLEASAGTFESAGDVTATLMARHVLATFAQIYEEPGATERLAESQARLQSLGVSPPASLRVGGERVKQMRHANVAKTAPLAELERLVVPLQRLAVRGAEPAHVQRELVAVASELITARPVRLEELDSNGAAQLLGGADLPASAFEWVELGDGGGRRLRLGALGPADDHLRALLAIIAAAGSLALEVALLRSIGNVRAERAGGEEEVEIPGLIGISATMRALRTEIAHVAASRSTVVIQGESGSGKELVAKAIHDLSPRARMPYVAFNCAAVPRELFEGQLFGYRKGAFTGAARDQPGVLRAAEGGTIFLDEIGELPLDVQPKLLRFLENGEIFPLGDKRPLQVDVRVVAATHRDLAALVRDGRFREDLYYRLQVIALRVAPLRERREDIAPLARHFLRKLSSGDTAPLLAPEALAKLTAYDWPGNVRELRNVIERALAYTPLPRVFSSDQLKLEPPR